MASRRTRRRLGDLWADACWDASPEVTPDEGERAVAVARKNRVYDLMRVVIYYSDAVVARDYPEFRAALFTDADLRRIGFGGDG